jgi:hypothetical protein
MAGDGARRVLVVEYGGLRCKPSGVAFVSCSQLGVVPAILAFFFYETDTPVRVVSLKNNIGWKQSYSENQVKIIRTMFIVFFQIYFRM